MHPAEQQKKIFIALICKYERVIQKVCSIFISAQEDYKDLYQEIILQTWIA